MSRAQVRALRELRRFAEAHPISLFDVVRALQSADPLGNREGHTITVPLGYRVTFTVDEQPSCWMRHLSLSVNGRRGALPGRLARRHGVCGTDDGPAGDDGGAPFTDRLVAKFALPVKGWRGSRLGARLGQDVEGT